MTVPVSNYSLNFGKAASSVSAGNRGAVSDSRFLQDNYGPGCYEVLLAGLEHDDYRVRAETILLFSRLGIRKPRGIIEEMSYHDKDTVVGACIAYGSAIRDADERIPELLYTVNHRTGTEYRNAMKTLGSIASGEQIPEIRKVMGQTGGEMREQARAALSRIIDRDPDLEPKRMFVLSDPIPPNERAFRAFLAKSQDYLDVRYRERVAPRSEVKLKTYNDVVHGILTMQLRLYNERLNLTYYSEDIPAEADRLSELIAWAAEDLKGKRVIKPEGLGRTSNIGDYS